MVAMKPRRQTRARESPARQLAGFIDKFDSKIAKLKGSGNQGRFIVFDEVDVLDSPAVEGLLRAAITQAKLPLPPTGRGYTVIKSISAKQRPRRPQRT